MYLTNFSYYLITVLAGGTGSIKLIRGLNSITSKLFIIVNVGDNFWLHGLYICPDIDTTIYGLAGILDKKRGWGIKADSFDFIKNMKKLDQDSWFKIGDKDLVTHIIRTKLINEGLSLSQATRYICRKYRISNDVIPATDTPVETRIVTNRGDLNIQDFWVKFKGKPMVHDVYYKNVENAKLNKEVIQALRSSRSIIIAPGNPVSSIGPIISIKTVHKELISNKDKIISISPIIGRKPISGPAGKYLKSKKIEISPLGIANFYSKFISKFVIHNSDLDFADSIMNTNVKPYNTNIIMRNQRDEVNLAKFISTMW